MLEIPRGTNEVRTSAITKNNAIANLCLGVTLIRRQLEILRRASQINGNTKAFVQAERIPEPRVIAGEIDAPSPSLRITTHVHMIRTNLNNVAEGSLGGTLICSQFQVSRRTRQISRNATTDLKTNCIPVLCDTMILIGSELEIPRGGIQVSWDTRTFVKTRSIPELTLSITLICSRLEYVRRLLQVHDNPITFSATAQIWPQIPLQVGIGWESFSFIQRSTMPTNLRFLDYFPRISAASGRNRAVAKLQMNDVTMSAYN
jgi:hypothetical protein